MLFDNNIAFSSLHHMNTSYLKIQTICLKNIMRQRFQETMYGILLNRVYNTQGYKLSLLNHVPILLLANII